jgi:hypothetical protein
MADAQARDDRAESTPGESNCSNPTGFSFSETCMVNQCSNHGWQDKQWQERNRAENGCSYRLQGFAGHIVESHR